MQIEGLFLTMIVPAPNGCNLKCPFCAIAQRAEALEHRLKDADYLYFLEDVARHLPITRLSLQGYEPLLPESWELSRQLFKMADQFDLETGLVTNGTYLSERAQELSGLADLIAVSLDSNIPAIHDRLRGVPGSFEITAEGIRTAVRYFDDAVSVNSVMFPKKASYLRGMPKFLASLGVRDWVISPLIDFRGCRYQAESEEVRNVLLEMTKRGAEYGINTYLGDELRHHDANKLYEELSASALEQSEYVVRLSPDGTCSRGREILAPSELAPVWDQKEIPHEFLVRILEEAGRKIVVT